MEAVVVMAIFAVIVGIVVVSYRNFLDAQRLNAGVEGTISMIQKARERTLSSRDESVGGTGRQYGVRFNAYTVGTLPNTVQLLDKTTGLEAEDSGSPGPKEETRFAMPAGVNIQTVSIFPAVVGNFDIYFKRISGDVTNSANSALFAAIIQIQSKNSGKYKSITVYSTGVVEVQ